MENYIENFKKHNKTLFNFLKFKENSVDYNTFNPHDDVVGICILMMVIQKINQIENDGNKKKVLISLKNDLLEVKIQDWYDVSKKNGFVNVVDIKEEVNAFNKNYLNVWHKLVYNACVDFIIKIS